VKISFVGPFAREGCSTLDYSRMSSFPMRAIFSLGRVFDEIRSPQELCYFLGWLPLGKFSPWITLRSDVSKWLIGVVCVRGMRSMWIFFIFYFYFLTL
jgi:hypothetical protein